jgi:regulator of ribonuclease activity A
MIARIQTADLYDEHGERLQVCDPLFRHFGGVQNFWGQIVTIRCFEDNSRIAEVVATPGNGRVLVIDAGGSLRCAVLGDRLAQKAVDQGWSGLLIYGCTRDCRDIGQMPLGVLALASNPRKTVKLGVGEVDVVIQFAGVTFRPGAYLYADEDGVVVSEQPLE